MEGPAARIKKSGALLEVRRSLGKFPAIKMYYPAQLVAGFERGDVAAGLAEVQHHPGNLPRSVQIGPDPVIDKLAVEGQ